MNANRSFERRSRSAGRAALAVLVALGTASLMGCGSKVYPHKALVDGPGESSAELLVIRKRETAGSGRAIRVDLDGESLVRLRTGTYALLHVRPGDYREVAVNTWAGTETMTNQQWIAGTRALRLPEGARESFLVHVAGFGGDMGVTPFFGVMPIDDDAAREMIRGYERISGD